MNTGNKKMPTRIANHFPFLSNKYSPPNVSSFLSFSLQWPIGGKEAKFIFNAFSLHTTVNFKNPIQDASING